MKKIIIEQYTIKDFVITLYNDNSVEMRLGRKCWYSNIYTCKEDAVEALGDLLHGLDVVLHSDK